MSTGGSNWRRFMFGNKSVPPATYMARPSALDHRSTASATVRAA